MMSMKVMLCMHVKSHKPNRNDNIVYESQENFTLGIYLHNIRNLKLYHNGDMKGLAKKSSQELLICQ